MCAFIARSSTFRNIVNSCILSSMLEPTCAFSSLDSFSSYHSSYHHFNPVTTYLFNSHMIILHTCQYKRLRNISLFIKDQKDIFHTLNDILLFCNSCEFANPFLCGSNPHILSSINSNFHFRLLVRLEHAFVWNTFILEGWRSPI